MTSDTRRVLDEANPLHHISFLSHARAVRLCVEGLQVYFSYKEHGGKEEALAAALTFRNTIPDRNIFSRHKAPDNIHQPFPGGGCIY